MLEGLRFAAYRTALGLATVRSFRSQEVVPLGLPDPHAPSVRPFAAAYPRLPVAALSDPDGFPPEDRPRLRRVESSARMLRLLGRLAPQSAAPVPVGPEPFVDTVYTGLLRRAWPVPPEPPAELIGVPGGDPPDVLALLAVAGPFASYLRAGEEAGTYVLDLSWLLRHPVRAGLLAPGGVADLAVADGALRTTGIRRHVADVPGDATQGWRPAPWRARSLELDAVLAGLNEDLTTFRHNLECHLATLTPFAVASQRRLRPGHPVRRLLHHCFHTVLVGNRELATLQLGSSHAFAARIFSHDQETLCRMVDDRLAGFDFWDFEPEQQFRTRGTTTTPFDYPYRDNVLELWRATYTYVHDYVRLYYADGAAVAADSELSEWEADLDALLPNGFGRVDRADPLDRLVRACATVIHLSTVEHDLLNNVVWDYATHGWLVPTVVPLNGERMDQLRAFELLATLIVTWKPYNMLLTSDIPALALDDPARAVMAAWLHSLEEIQAAMTGRGRNPWLSYPANLNVSISN